MTLALLFAIGLLAGTLAGVVGTGASLILLPILVVLHGPKEAVPIMAIASVMANLGRIGAWWRNIDWRLLFRYSLGSVPCAALGAGTLVAIPAWIVDATLGLFLLAVIPLRRQVQMTETERPAWLTVASGAGVGFLTGLVQSTGPLSVAVFAAYGLKAGVLLGTESAASLLIYGMKTSTFGVLGVITRPLLLSGIFVGTSMLLGAFSGKRIVKRIGEKRFDLILDIIMGFNAVVMLAAAVHEYGQSAASV